MYSLLKVIPEFLLSKFLTIFNKMVISNFLSETFGEKGAWGRGGGGSCPVVFFDSQKLNKTFSFQSNGPSLKFI